MNLRLGRVLQEKRREKQITQQELANFMNVTKTSVSKWENDQSYPDITLLPLLAAYFDMTIDELLNYEPQLSQEEIQHLYTSLQHTLKERSGAEAWATLQRLTKRYYSCYPLILQLGNFILNHFDLFPGADASAKKAQYIPQALDLFQHVTKNASAADLLVEAEKMQAYCLLVLGRPDEVLKILGHYTPPAIPPDSLIAGAYQLKGELPAAQQVLQSSLFQNAVLLLSSLTNYLQILGEHPSKFLVTYEKGLQHLTTFQLATCNPAATLNFYLAGAHGFSLQQDAAHTLTALGAAVTLLEKNKELKICGDEYFDQLTPWLEHVVRSGEIPRESSQVFTFVKQFILTNPQLVFLAHHETFIAIQQRAHALTLKEESA